MKCRLQRRPNRGHGGVLRTTRRSRAGAARGGGTPCATSRAGRSAAWSGRTFFLHTAITASARIAVVRQGRRAKVASKNPSPPTQPPLREQQLQVGCSRRAQRNNLSQRVSWHCTTSQGSRKTPHRKHRNGRRSSQDTEKCIPPTRDTYLIHPSKPTCALA